MTIEQKDKDQMADLIRIMNAGINGDPMPQMKQDNSATFMGIEVDAKADMKRILESLQGVNNPVQNLKQRAIVDRELREALTTDITESGTKIGSWEIVTQENENRLKTFDIVNIHTGEAIATDLSLYDAAFGIVRTLNEGGAINSLKVREILVNEAEYGRMRQNAANFRERVQYYSKNVLREGADDKLAVAQSRFQDALARAKSCRARIEKLAK